jgi:hypothetical protein
MKGKIFLGVIGSLAIVLCFFALSKTAGTKDLEKELARIKLNQERLFAINAIQNLMGKYCLYHFAHLRNDPKNIGLFADDPDTIYQTSSGGWKGQKALERFNAEHDIEFIKEEGKEPDFAGALALHPMTTPIIVVAGDCKTAKGVWISPGIEARTDKDGVSRGIWLTVKYAVDFKKVGEEWKILHMRVNAVYLVGIGNDFVGQKPGETGPGIVRSKDPKYIPDLKYAGQPMYDATTVQVLDPEPPKPYETWDDSMSYLPQK